jgi:hypothetical protein
MLSPPATYEAGAHAAGDTKSEHFEPARLRKLNEKQFNTVALCFGYAKTLCWRADDKQMNRTKGTNGIFADVTYAEEEIAKQFPTERNEF